MKILILDNGKKLFNAVNRELNDPRHELQYAADGNEGLNIALERRFDMIVLDWALAKKGGLRVLQELRGLKNLTPVLMLTTEDSGQDFVESLESGANACAAKTLDVRILISRINALLRREKWDRGAVISYAYIRLDPVTHQVWKDEKEVDLTTKEYSLLAYLLRNAEQVVTRKMIAENVWKTELDPYTNIIDVYVNYLRKKIGCKTGRKLIHTVRGTGYLCKFGEA